MRRGHAGLILAAVACQAAWVRPLTCTLAPLALDDVHAPSVPTLTLHPPLSSPLEPITAAPFPGSLAGTLSGRHKLPAPMRSH